MSTVKETPNHRYRVCHHRGSNIRPAGWYIYETRLDTIAQARVKVPYATEAEAEAAMDDQIAAWEAAQAAAKERYAAQEAAKAAEIAAHVAANTRTADSATPRQIDYITGLLIAREVDGDTSGHISTRGLLVDGVVQTAELQKLTKRQASALIDSLKGM